MTSEAVRRQKSFYDWKMEAYWRLPVRLQEAFLSLYAGWLDSHYFGRKYREKLEWLSGWKHWSQSQTDELRNERLLSVLKVCAERVPFYRELWKAKGVRWGRVKDISGLQELPVTEKQQIRSNEEAFIADGFDAGSLWLQRTSGTTGTALKIYWSPDMLSEWHAVMELMVRGPAGVSRETPRAMMGGRPVVRGAASEPPFWRFNRRWKQLYFSSYHVSTKTAPSYIEALKRYGSRWMTGYGSAIAALSESAAEANIEPPVLKSIITSGDTLTKKMRKSIENYFQCRCFDHYGQSEGVAMAMECIYGRMHTVPNLGFIEILREDESPCDSGEVGEIVATGIVNEAMPLIRYRTGDYGAWAETAACPCGNPAPVITSLEGRVDDYLITLDGRKIGRLSTAIKRSPSMHSAQLVQYRPGHAYFLVKPGEGYKPSHAGAVCDDIMDRIGRFELEIIEVEDIPRTRQGKTVLVVRLDEKPALRPLYDRITQHGR